MSIELNSQAVLGVEPKSNSESNSQEVLVVEPKRKRKATEKKTKFNPDPNYTLKIDLDNYETVTKAIKKIDKNNIAIIVRPYFKNNEVHCMCLTKDNEPIKCKTSSSGTSYVCGNYGTDKQMCGFSAQKKAVKRLIDYQILKSEKMAFPVCKECRRMNILLFDSEKTLPINLNKIEFVCSCQPYSEKETFEINTEELCDYFNLDHYEASRTLDIAKTSKGKRTKMDINMPTE